MRVALRLGALLFAAGCGLGVASPLPDQLSQGAPPTSPSISQGAAVSPSLGGLPPGAPALLQSGLGTGCACLSGCQARSPACSNAELSTQIGQGGGSPACLCLAACLFGCEVTDPKCCGGQGDCAQQGAAYCQYTRSLARQNGLSCGGGCG